MSKQTILTGLRTNAEYHLGNYLGALLPMIHMAHTKAGTYRVNLFAPDLHSFTTPIDHAGFYEQTLHNIKLLVACGLPIEHEDVFIYRQSHVPAHAELAWILACFTGFGEMSRMVEFKEKSERFKEDRVSIGLFTYPILMAADILLYGAKWVPVGEDQRQHLEFVRDLAMRFNSQFGDVFTIPETIAKQQEFVSRDAAPRIRSLKDPTKKMSKSVSDPAGTILLGDAPHEAAKKIMSATTDSVGAVHFDPVAQPGITNLLTILSLLSGEDQDSVNARWDGVQHYGDLKKEVADIVAATLENIQNKLVDLDTKDILASLESGEEAMQTVSSETLHNVQKAVGLRSLL